MDELTFEIASAIGAYLMEQQMEDETDSETDSETEDSEDADDGICAGCVLKNGGCFLHEHGYFIKIFELSGCVDYTNWCSSCINMEGDCMIPNCNIQHYTADGLLLNHIIVS